MIMRFFKKKPKAVKPKKIAPEKPKPVAAREKPAPVKQKQSPPKKILTAEGWKRLMMRKTNKIKNK